VIRSLGNGTERCHSQAFLLYHILTLAYHCEIMETLKSRLESIKKSLRDELSSMDAPKIAPRPLGPMQVGAEASPVIYSDELNYLNAHWGDWAEPSHFTSHRPIIGRFLVRVKRKLQNFLLGSLFKDYLEKEKCFSMNLVRFCNETARYIDSRDKQIFWQLVTKLDREVKNLEMRGDSLIMALVDEVRSAEVEQQNGVCAEEHLNNIKTLQERFSILEKKIAELESQIQSRS